MIHACSMQELGRRSNQEDSIFPPLGAEMQDCRLFIVCDGMGGHERGEVASRTVCESMSRHILSHRDVEDGDSLLLAAIDAAYNALDMLDDGAERKMGTTLALLMLHDDGATVAHIGDSRVYHLRPADGCEPARILFRTNDHSLVNDLLRLGELTEEEAKTFPQRNVITRAMMPHQERRARADVAHISDIRPGDYFFLCSDGVLERMEDDQLLSLLTNSEDADEEKLEILRRATRDNSDNHSAHLVHVVDDSGGQSFSFKKLFVSLKKFFAL
ncbi:MAG: protein phosphatase 2C domain-containing protein [Bacteroidaceae bacterium]|nr:protein phosphatase 2C domain-containing protein [Bacteroidaceae bacterium]